MQQEQKHSPGGHTLGGFLEFSKAVFNLLTSCLESDVCPFELMTSQPLSE